ncbi:MAG: hypothetical protein NC818_05170 [Candidatus Omnitrophica bacterium]|nr:hypothetical protein [Candidatus Omnitrophota bacterium]
MKYYFRRIELGKMFIDVAKYIVTIIVIGTLFSEKINLRILVLGICLALAMGIIGFLTLPLKED